MAFIGEKRGLVPPPLNHDVKDRFGLPLKFSLLGESSDDLEARFSAVERLVEEAFESVARHLGHDEARRRFANVARKPKRGKQANKERNDELLTHYDRELSGGSIDEREAPRRIAEALYKNHGSRMGPSAESIEKRIRRAIATREKARAEEERRILMYQAAVAMNAPGTFRR